MGITTRKRRETMIKRYTNNMTLQQLVETEEYQRMYHKVYELEQREALTKAMRLAEKALDKSYHPDVFGFLADVKVALLTSYEGTPEQITNTLKDKINSLYAKANGLDVASQEIHEASGVLKQAFINEPSYSAVADTLTLMQNRRG